MKKRCGDWSDMSKFHVAYIGGQPQHGTVLSRSTKSKTVLIHSKHPKPPKSAISKKSQKRTRNIPGSLSNVSPSYKLRYISGPVIFVKGGIGRPR